MTAVPAPQASALAERFARVRAQTLELVRSLSEADCQVQSMPDASPAKWHLAHVTWFFETFVLEPLRSRLPCRIIRPSGCCSTATTTASASSTHAPQRGLITRPGLAEVMAYRRAGGRAHAAPDRRPGRRPERAGDR